MGSSATRCTLMILAGVATACRSDRPKTDTAAPPAEATPAAPASVSASSSVPVIITATEFKLDLPATIPAGVVTMELRNEGKQLHHAQLVRFEDGKTVADLAQAMKTEGPPPPWLKFLGGPNGIAPGGTATATALLAPGHYAVLCFIPGPDGIPHVAKGMIQPFEVTAASGSADASLPSAGDTVRLVDYRFEASRPLTPGRHTILVENAGPQAHELVVVKLDPGKSVNDFGAWAMTMKGPPPGMPIGGIAGLDKDARGEFIVDLPAGEYAFMCFVPDSKDGKMHFQHGMVQQFSVK
jgi:uncharacterized cupredoxin-like copper-binding protein